MIVRPDQWTAMPWKNGGGTTHEIWKDRDPFTVRFSVAEVSADGPFSRFDGIDRIITLVEGNGFELTGTSVARLTKVGVPFAFRGEDPYDCRLLNGPVRDLNVMTSRALWVATVFRAEAPPNAFVFALTDGVRVGETTLGRHDLFRAERGGRVTGRAFVVGLTPLGHRRA